MPYLGRRMMNWRLAVLYPNLIGTLHNDMAVGTVWPVEVMNPDHPVHVHDLIMPVVNDDTRAEDAPGALNPGAPPGRIVLPAIRRNVNDVLPAQNVLDRFPIVHVDKAAIIRTVSASAIGIPFGRFYDDLFPVQAFISYNLQDSLPSADDLNFNNGHVLYIIPVHQRLQDNGMKIPLPPVFHPDVINPAVIIQVQVVDPILFRVELPFKVP